MATPSALAPAGFLLFHRLRMVDTSTRILPEQLGLLGYRVPVAKDHVEAVNDETSGRFIVRGNEFFDLADELAAQVGIAMQECASCPASDESRAEVLDENR